MYAFLYTSRFLNLIEKFYITKPLKFRTYKFECIVCFCLRICAHMCVCEYLSKVGRQLLHERTEYTIKFTFKSIL